MYKSKGEKVLFKTNSQNLSVVLGQNVSTLPSALVTPNVKDEKSLQTDMRKDEKVLAN